MTENNKISIKEYLKLLIIGELFSNYYIYIYINLLMINTIKFIKYYKGITCFLSAGIWFHSVASILVTSENGKLEF